ncbi:nonribosomal peptide synthase [Cucurbitaria berberidis CBS 394.84]|uniref:Nonribosomal peptide synthase n=1 Tax=Cucurbitaria berberidis CBS 394.84 TaxID=1168544 RepID=A0A9P4LBV4_9PLEO|nr:nonribosomal peptide synthase [Cucurbitaria berberidis CBS 394.84]KAF1848737.1 nonribosomal peptide synthase [Cucurbitaria berberidis CBS 394.84]
MEPEDTSHVESLQSIWAHVLNLPRVALDQPFLSVGGDSISAMQVVGQCRKEGMSLGVQEVLRSRSIIQLANAVKEVESSSYEHEEYFDEEFDLSPIQSLYFQRPNTHGHFNQSFYLRVTRRTAAQQFQSAVEQLISRHSMLRARFSFSEEQGWQQRLTNDIAGSHRFRHSTVSSQGEIDALIEDSQQCFDHSNGPLFAADFFDFGNEQYAFLTGHHLVVDLVTWRLLLEELEEILKGGQLLAPALPFQKWAELQSEHAETLQLDEVLPHVNVPALDFSYWGIQHEDNTYGNAGHASFELDTNLSSAFLTTCHTAYKTEPVEVLLASLIQSWSHVFTDRPVPAIFNEGHGREPWSADIDITRTVGWFTALSPILVTPSQHPTETVRKTKDFKRRIPGNGRPYFARRCLTKDGREQFKTHWPMEILFNYLGQYQQLERPDALLQPLGTMAGETGKSGGTSDFGHDTCRWGLFEISAFVFKGHLKVAFTFNRHMEHQGLIQQWISECQTTISKMIQGLIFLDPKPTVSDFPLPSLTEDSFYSMLERLSGMGITESDVEDVYPCSGMQEGLLLSQTKDAGFYAAATLHEIKTPNGPLLWESVVDAWRQVVRRHPALRTVFLENVGAKEGLYNQVVLKDIAANIVHIKCENELDAVRHIEEQRSVSYNNGRCPNHRFTICNTEDGRTFCSLEISHAIMDGHSMSMLVFDLQRACEGQLRSGGPPYSDYISWLMKQPQESSLEFWKSYLGGSEVCSFPVLHDGRTIEKELISIRMDLTSIGLPDLQGFCNTHGITLSNVFHTAWALTLSCYVGSDDVTFGYLTSARDSEEVYGVEDMCGPIINTLVCRVNLTNGSRCLLDVLQDVQRDYMEAIPHRHIALADVQHVVELSGASLFNTALSYRRLPQEQQIDDSSLRIVEVRPIYDPTEYPVSLNIEVGDTAAAVDLDYWTDHLSAAQAVNVASTFARALENIVFNAKRRISALDHLSPRHLEQIQNWNVIPATLNECVHHMFAKWVATQPDAPAICGFDGSYTYAELDAVTNRLAHHLVKLGVGPEVFVPTCFDKSALAVVAMLSVLKAGGAAVPLDATHPKPALQTRLEDAGAQIVLTTPSRAEKFEGLISSVVIVNSAFLESLSAIDGPACTSIQPHNPAFVIFTSGSTGRPKGVVLEHSAIVTSAEAHGSKIGLGQGSRMLQFASYTFDNSLEEMFTTLQRGGCVCVPSEADRVNDLGGAIARLNVNIVDLTPTVAALLTPAEVPTLKRLCLGAEPLTKALIELWRPHVSVMGQYGPSEASINSAWRDFKDGGEATNIGKAIGCVSWIVDPDNRNRLAPIGCKGELLLEGPILSRGYLNDVQKTQAAFILDPEWACTAGPKGRRFYCTGDLVQYTSDGEMMYLGRKDSQVKLNGQRIELGEIEHHLKLNLPSGAKSAVELVKFNDSNATKALVAFMCLNNESAASNNHGLPLISEMTDSVRAVAKQVEVTLANALPVYYVPTIFMPVTNMPMTTSGKLDRKVLRQLATEVPESQLTPFRLAGKSGRAPSGHVESMLARIWALVLKVSADTVGAEDSFFRLGGDSISAMRLVTAARKEGLLLNVANVFAQPKLLEMAATVVVLSSDELTTELERDTAPFELLPENARQRITDFAASECGVISDSIEDIYPCSKLQEGLIMLSNKDPGTYVVQPIYRLPSDIDLDRFKQAWQSVFATEAVLRTRIIYTEQDGFLQVVLREELKWHALADLQEINETTRQLPAKNGAPLTTFTIVGENSVAPCFVWTAHHAVYDGWSWATLFRRVESYYRKTTQDVPPSVPYTRFIKYLSILDQKQSDEFWLSNLDNMTAPQFPKLPSPGHRVEANSQLLHVVNITREPSIEVTIPSMIRAAWGLLLATYSGSDDVLWGETNSGREASVPGIESVIGPTITTAPIRLRLNRRLTVHQYLRETQRQSSTSLPYQFAGLQHIRKLSSETAVACDFQSFLGIEVGDSLQDADSALWNMESANTIGTDFFSYALIFNCQVKPDSVHIEALYDNQVIEPWLVQRLLQQFEFILTRFNSVEALDRALDDVGLLNPADQEAITVWNGKPVHVVNRCIHSVIKEDQTTVRPTAAAVEAWDTGVMTYRELDERATRLASHLVSLGVKPQQFVPLCFDKSGWTIVAILAVLKAGAAFVPLDFEAPILRLRELVGDVEAELLLCAPQYEALCMSIPCNTLIVNRETTEQGHARLNKLPDVQSDSPAYAFYTSGSTGKPKGAVINHSHWVTSSTAFAPGWEMSETSRVLQFASYTFDACLIEIFSTLMCGGTVCVPDQASRTNDLVGVINKFNVNWATLTPSVVRMMQPSQVPQLKMLVLVGEAMSQQDLHTWADRVTLGNGYGPTECAAISTSNVMTLHTKPNNLGKAVTAQGWIVSKDNHHTILPVGAIGELLLEGGAVGVGYLKNPEKTAQAFITHVKWPKGLLFDRLSSKLRIYKTGDLVMYNEDGTMLYLGRKDSQTKVRGQRLELSEVEHHLMDDDLIQNALASVPTAGPCAKRLVGIVSLQNCPPSTTLGRELQILTHETASLNIFIIRDHLCERLPSYMIPSLWVAIQQFPLMPSGKMDRRCVLQWLEKMDRDTYRAISSLGSGAPQTDASAVERKLQAIFANVLNLPSEDVRLTQSFLHLGGDSIAAMQVSSKCRAQGLAMSVQDIIRSKSITTLASTVDASSQDRNLITSEAQEYNFPFEVSPIQKVFFDTVGNAHNHFNQTEIFRLARNFDLDEIKHALTALVEIHPMLRGRFARDESGTWRQRVEKDTKKSFRLRQHHVQVADDATLRPILDASQATLDIMKGPTFAVDIFEANATFSQAIALVAHHLIIDVVSWGVLLEDLQNLLNGINPPPQSLPYHAWLQLQSTQAKQETAKRVFPIGDISPTNFDYWGMGDSRNVSGDAIEEDFQLSTRDTMLLLGAQDALSTEILDILVAALFESFRKVFPDRTTITIHNEGHGREPFKSSQDLSRTVGWFSTLTPISLPVPPEETTDIVSTIRWVKDVRARTPDKGRPYFAYRNLTEEGHTRFASHWPAEAVFNYVGRLQNMDRKDALFSSLDGIDSREIGEDVPRLSIFDITAAVSQGAIKLSFGWNRHMKRQAEIRTWVAQCKQTLVDAVDELLLVRPEPSLGNFKHLPLLYNGMSRVTEALPSSMTIADIEDIYPTSPMQQGLLLTQSRNPELYTYHTIFEVQATDRSQPVDPHRLAEAWQIVVHRHPALRTVFIDSVAKNGSKDQIVIKDKAGRVQFTEDCADIEVADILREQPAIDCREATPPHRMTICKTVSGRVWIKLELSHVINDGTSISNILGDLASAYARRLSRADAGPLYSDYIAYILSSSRDTDVAYWTTYLSGVEPCLFPALNDGKSRPHESGSIDIHLGGTKDIYAFCKRNGVTLSNVLQLAWALTLHCYVGASDVSFGLVASGRDIPVKNIDEAVGCFVNMLIVRLTFSDETTISHLLEALQTGSMNALSHQGCSLADVQHELKLSALFNTAFTFQRRNLSRDPEETALIYDNMEAADSGEYAVTINADVTDESISVDFGFWKDKILPVQAQNMADTFQTILQDIITSSADTLTVGNLDIFTSGSLRQIMDWNVDLPLPIRRCVHEVIHEQALTRPRSTKAVEGWDGTFTYQEFDRITDQLATHLQAIGVTTETFIPILFDKSSWAIVSMIAIMKAGGAYVPLDPKHPQTRLCELINDVGAKVLLCSRNYHDKASEVATTPLIVDQRSVRKISVPAGTKPKSTASPDNAAYCLFTSGTTGKPKGTIIPHQAFCTSAAAFTRRMNINATSRTFQFASYTFDASCIEILSALTVGASVCVPTEDDRMNNPAGAIRKFKANWSLLTPSVLGTIEPERVPCLKTLVSGGEALPGLILKKWGNSTCFINAYGPTETAVVAATSYKSTLDHKLIETDPGTIGFGSGCRLWIVHPRNHDKLMPVGSVGELIIEGPTVARGYLNDEVKTNKAFIADPKWALTLPSDNGTFQTSRMYKSGDLVRYNSDGSVSYIGRKDTQIKLNGQRIELGEIEFHVGKNFPEYVQSAVELVSPSSRSSAKALAVFFTIIQNQSSESADVIQRTSTDLPAPEELLLPMSGELRDLCKATENGLGDSLPPYMVPSIFIPVTKMPWTSAGKLDRNRLRNLVQDINRDAMAFYRLTNAVNKKHSSNESEKKLHKAVCSVLNLPASSVGIDDSFVRLGGDSVSAMRLVASAQAEHLELSFIDIFKNPKLADLARIGTRAENSYTLEKAIQPFELLQPPLIKTEVMQEVAQQCRVPKDDIQDIFPTSPLQDALITLSIKQTGAYVAQHVLALPSPVDINKFKAAWEKLIQETDILRTRIAQMRSGAFVQVVPVDDTIIWQEVSSLHEAEKETAQIPSHLGGRLASYTIVRTLSNERFFVWTVHHSLYDGWSIYLMLQRVQQIYQTGSSKLTQTPYTKFIKYLMDAKKDASIKFWKECLAGATPFQFPQQSHSISERISEGQTLQHAIKLAPSRHADVTASNVIRAAWALLLSAYTGSDDVIFGETLAGRDIAVTGITDVCGPTLTTVPTRVKINRDATVTNLLGNISATATDRIPYQHHGLSDMKRISDETAAACDFQNLLVVQNENEELSDSIWSVYDKGEQSGFFTYPLVIECKMSKSTTQIMAHYDATVISTWEVQRLLYQLESVLTQLNSVIYVREVHVLSKQDKDLVRKWNQYEPKVVDDTVPALFFKQVVSQPDAIAVSAFDGEFTYAEVGDLASQFAQELVELGARPDQLVPICLDKSRWAIVTIMAILISGAGYVPLSPAYPTSRHRQIIEACKGSIVLCSPLYENRFANLADRVFSVSEANIRELPICRSPILLPAKSNNICYVIFTSGSTGIPKGVVVEHRNIVSSSAAICKGLHITPSSRVFQFCSFLFDVSVGETLAVLMCGATICVPSEEQRTADLASAITTLQATWAFLTPSVANTLEGPHVVPTLKTLVTGGEAMTSEIVEKWASGLQLYNGYGPTEGAVFAVTNDLVSVQRDPSNIGRMLSSGRAWLTNPRDPNELAPVGAVAELCLEGALLARGYLNEPERTAESFVQNPGFMKVFSQGPSRTYRTGDLVRYAPDGSLHYLGRKDNQVKLAGQRIELGEIEHHLHADHSVWQAVVQLPKTGPCEKKLTAVLSFRSTWSSAVDTKQPWHQLLVGRGILSQINHVRDRLSDLVPSYMIPTIWIAVSRIPFLASMKFDRKQVGAWLEGMDDTTYQQILELEASEDTTNTADAAITTLRKIWATVLNKPVDVVKANRSWLSLGGDSITAMKLLAKCRSEGITLSLNQVLRAKSLANLAQSVKSTTASNHGKEQTDKHFDLSPIQQFYFKTNDAEKNTHFNQSSTLRLSKKVEPTAVNRAINSIVECHSMLRARFSKTYHGQWQQSITSDISNAYSFKVHDVRTLSATVAIISSTQKCLDIGKGPVFAVDLFNLQTGEQVLFIAAHHLIIDVVSWGIILSDLEDLLISQPAVSLQKELPFQLWCEQQYAHANESHQAEAMIKQSISVLPADIAFWGMEKRDNVYGDVERDQFFVDRDISAMALDNHAALKTDVVDLLVASILHSFSRVFINRKPPTIFNESHGREVWESSNLDLSRTVGWFTAMYPITVPIGEEEDDVVHTVRQVKDCRRKVTDNGRPYFTHRFLTEDGKQRYAEHAPIEVLFNYLGRQESSESGDSLFQPIQFDEDEEDETSDVGSKTTRMALFEISAVVSEGQLQLIFMYNRRMKNQKGIRRWIAECQRTLEEIVTNLAEIKTWQATMADFPLLPLESYSRLDRVLKSLPSIGISSYDQVEDIYPCSSIQDGIILSQIKNPESYWSSTTFEMKSRQGPVDSKKVAEAWKKVVDRHPALRTVFIDSVCRGGVFDQIVIKDTGTGLIRYTCDDSELFGLLDSIKYSELNGKKKPALPHQAVVVQSTSGKIVVKIIVNHAIIDGGSLAIIGRDLQEAYKGSLSNEEGPLYSNYIRYLRNLPANDAIDYWKGKLGGVRPCYFPTTYQNTSRQRQLRSLDMNFDRFSEVHILAGRTDVTFANVLLAAWALVLRSYVGSSDVCYGYLTSGRNVPINDIESAVGAFINMLVSRLSVTPALSLLLVIQQVKNDFIESMPHQHCSLAQFQHDLGLSGKALFNTAVSIQTRVTTDDSTHDNAGIEFQQLDGHDPSEFAITVNIDATRDDEAVRFTYWSDAITDGEAKNVSSLMAKILDQALVNVNQTVAELDATVKGKAIQAPTAHLTLPKPRPSILRSRSNTSYTSNSSVSPSRTPRITFPDLSPATPLPPETPDWNVLIRSIVSEMVPQIVDQIVAKNKLATEPASATIDQMTSQMTGFLTRRASQSLRGRPNLETGSIRGSVRSRRMSVASNAENRIQIAADMVAAVGVLATEGSKSVAPDFVEKKLLGLWSELLEMVDDTIEQDDSFFQLGGDSIIAMRLVGAAREEGLSMTVADVFKNPTFADMARVVRVAGELIDEVMSRAGGESITGKDTGGPSRPTYRLTKQASSIWDDYRSVVSEYNVDGKSMAPSTPPAEPEPARNETMFKKWQGFASGIQPSRPQVQRKSSQKSQVPQTIQEGVEVTAPKSISLLGDPNVDSVISKVQVFKGGISDVFPVTDFQALAITGTLMESKWMLNYFYLDGNGPLDLRKLKQAAFRMVQAFDILRTVFVPYGDRFLQVVLRKLQPDFIYQQTDDDLDMFTTKLRQKDREHGPRLGEAFIQFVVAKQKQSGRYRIFMRLSHAQYDGVCMSRILGALQDGYNGLPVSSAPSFGNFVKGIAKTVAGAHDHWKEILRGSSMTEIVNRFGPSYQRSAGRTVTLEQTLTVPTLSRVNITAATVVKAAWAATLARVASKSDIVFGHVISGRNGNVANVESIVGPCLNMVPVRVVYRPEWTVLDLLHYIQDQQISNMPYESLGFREITRHCTDWPDWTNFSSVLQHDQNIQEENPMMQLGGVEFNVGAVGSQEDFADFSIHSTSRGGSTLEVTLTYSPNSTITAEFAQNVFEMLCANTVAFSGDPHTLLPSPSELSSQSSTTINSDKMRIKAAEKQPVALPTDTGLSKHEINTLATTLRAAWEQILHDEHGSPTPSELSSDFFQLGGDIMGLAQVASILDHEGFRVRVEDLIDKSVFVEQVSLLAVERKKQIEKERQSPWGEKVKSKTAERVKTERTGSGFGAFARKMGFKGKESAKA